MAPRYRLRTLLILLAVLPPLLGVAWVKYAAWKAEQAQRTAIQKAIDELLAQEARLQRMELLSRRSQGSPVAAEAARLEQAAVAERLRVLQAAMQKLDQPEE